ncbi:MAG: Oxalate-binding protein [Chloroflexi bacterium]|nr:Oxalate-binding protein [Chloroflexota bacterium]
MHIIKKEDLLEPFQSPTGELIYELIGRPKEHGGASKHSLAHVIVPPQFSSLAHYHKISEETYYILEGRGRMILDGQEFTLSPGQACLIMPGEVHQIFNDQEEELVFLAICAPAWTPEDSFDVD